MEQFDVLIVGGGPAGSSAAWAMRNSGLTVAILDKAQFPRNKICAGWVTPQVLQALNIEWREYARDQVLQPIHGFRVGSIGAQEEVDVTYPAAETPVSFGIRRCEFDHYLLKRSQATLLLGNGLQTLRRNGSGWIANDSIAARTVIGAGGHFCPVARHLGARLGSDERVVAAQEVEYEMDAAQSARCALHGELPAIQFCQDLKGYGWAFRKGRWLNIGIGREDSHRLGEHLHTFYERLIDTGRIPERPQPRFQGHAYLLANHALRPLVAEGALLVGDAAGLAYPQSGEGIRPAVESGLIAGQLLADCSGNLDTAKLARYQSLLSERFGPRANALPQASASPLKQALGRALLKIRWFDRRVVIDRWFLHRGQPTLQLSDIKRSIAA